MITAPRAANLGLRRGRRDAPRNACVALAFLLIVTLEVALFYFTRETIPFEETRAGEDYVSDDAFLACLANLVEATGLQIPFVIIPVTLEYLDMKTYICSLNTPVRYMMIIVSGNFSPFLSLATKVSSRFAHTGRVMVQIHPGNLGYAASMNEGLKSALQHPPQVVPWVLLTNSDVRYAKQFWPDMMKTISALTVNDTERLQQLQAEKLQETLHGGSLWPQGYGSGSPTAVASNLLPDRIRRLPNISLNEAFATHVGLFYATDTEDMCSFVRTRLHIETVGYFDENYYPIYGEDHDLQWRSAALGFKFVVSAPKLVTHYVRANMKAMKEDYNGRVVARTGELGAIYSRMRRMSRQRYRWLYRHAKWFRPDQPLGTEKQRNQLPFGGDVPVDVWVRDDARIQRIRDAGDGRQASGALGNYELSLLNPYNLSRTGLAQ